MRVSKTRPSQVQSNSLIGDGMFPEKPFAEEVFTEGGSCVLEREIDPKQSPSATQNIRLSRIELRLHCKCLLQRRRHRLPETDAPGSRGPDFRSQTCRNVRCFGTVMSSARATASVSHSIISDPAPNIVTVRHQSYSSQESV